MKYTRLKSRASSVEEALAAIADDDEVWVIGGAEVYKQFLPYYSKLVVTKNRFARPADAFFPNIDADDRWNVVEETASHPS